MEILVCLKQVPDDSVEIHLKPGTQEVNLDGVTSVVNAFDTYALEMATRLKEAIGGNITAITVGPEGAKDAVKTCLAVGANQGYVGTDPTFEALGLGVITDLVDIQQTDTGIQAKQETEEGYRLVDASLPCVVTVNKPPYDPRYPTIKNKLAARKMPIPALDAAALGGVAPGAAGSHVVKVYEPAKRQAGVKIKEETCEETVAKAIAMMADAKVL